MCLLCEAVVLGGVEIVARRGRHEGRRSGSIKGATLNTFLEEGRQGCSQADFCGCPSETDLLPKGRFHVGHQPSQHRSGDVNDGSVTGCLVWVSQRMKPCGNSMVVREFAQCSKLPLFLEENAVKVDFTQRSVSVLVSEVTGQQESGQGCPLALRPGQGVVPLPVLESWALRPRGVPPIPRTWPAPQSCALTGNRPGDPLVCRSVLNPLSYTSQGVEQFFKINN